MSGFNPYPKGGRSEADMRQEMNNFLDGSFPEIAKAQVAVLRKMRRDSNGKLIKCECVDPTTHEPDKDTFCPICHGEGFKWDESFIEVYKILLRSDVGKAFRETLIEPGLMNVPIMVFYTRSSVQVTESDKIVQLELDTEGNPVKPYRRQQLYRVVSAVDYRADGGRLEYWKLACYAEKRNFLNGA